MEEFGKFIMNTWGLWLGLAFIVWMVWIFATAKYWNEEHNYYYSAREIYEDAEGNDVVTFMRGEETITFIHMEYKYKKLTNK